MHVDRCVCFDVTFRRLKDHADATGADFAELQRTFGCGRGCGLCVPYICRMLRTGETSIPLMSGTALTHGDDGGAGDKGE
jgi:bacterioferritin-associated ferredoxin